ncbi:hypothetical protein ACWI_36390 [Acetobacterium wieringae]|uniref:Uncharacterized protein n=1 Tax=Acetobacterium wieringae TaxID=52694 RepID=A0A1F2PCB5_9FIRM|nr:hypothetical protein ACWI_36390 [Acetobacterium wieringae]
MTEKDKELIALFRYGLIAPLLTDTVTNHTAYLDEVSAKTHDVPHYGIRPTTVKPCWNGTGCTGAMVLMRSSPRFGQTKGLPGRYRQNRPNGSLRCERKTFIYR